MKSMWKLLGGVCLATCIQQAGAEDIDLFLGVPPASTTELPNVLLLIDNTANWETAFTNEKAALVSAFDSLDLDEFNVGIMFFGQPDLGYLRAHIRTMDAINRPLYSALVGGLDVSNDRASARTLSRTMSEIYRYFKGQQTTEASANPFHSGENKWRDYSGNTNAPAATQVVHALGDNPLSSQTDYTYTSPISPSSCGGTYVIYIGNNVSSGNVVRDNSSRNSAAGSELAAAGGDTSQIPLTYTAHQDNFADEWARFMHEDLGVVFFAIDVNPTPHPDYDGATGHSNGMGNSELIRSMSEGVSNGKYFRVDSSVNAGEEIEDALDQIFTEIQADNSVFASVALPASAAGQSIFLNQVFIGLFRPDASAYPKWPGNLKQYQLGKTAGAITLRDANGAAAISSNADNRFIADCAVSFWTDDIISSKSDNYWTFAPSGDCTGAANHNSPDGPIVEKGAQALILRQQNPTTRDMYTCSFTHNSCTSLANFNTSNGELNTGRLGVATTAEKDDLIRWARGSDSNDVNGDDAGSADLNEMRAYVHGDIIHSRPVALNYGTDASPEVVVYYGANDGALRAVNGNQTGTFSGTPPGGELWSFMPPEFWDDLERLKTNTNTIKFPATGPLAGATGTPKTYGMDGTVTAYAGSGQKHIYATMRRGGRSIYAFNVTSPNSPTLAWKRGCMETSSGTTCSTGTDPDGNGWTDIGETWSPASVVPAAGHTNPVILMGGGYDDCEDYDNGSVNADGIPVATPNKNHNCTGANTGDHIYIVDAYNGNMLKVFDTDRAVPGGITVVSVSDTNSAIQYAYAADTGGNVYRISGPMVGSAPTPIGSSAPANWHMEKIASFGCGTTATATCSAPRKFLFAPDVVRPLNTTGEFQILLGSGDREKPLLKYPSAYAVENYFYSFTDKPTDATWMEDTTPSTCGDDVLCMNRLSAVTSVSSSAPTIASTHGYYLHLRTGEQVVTGVLVVDDVANFSTHIAEPPASPGACTNELGTATVYNINFLEGAGQTVKIIGGGLVPTPVAGKVIIDGEPEPFCIGCGGENSPIGGGTVGGSASLNSPKGRVHWKIQK